MILVSSQIEFSLRVCGLMKPRVSPIFIAAEVRADDLSPSAHTNATYGSHNSFCSNIVLLDRSITSVMAAVMSVADVRSVSDAEALLAQLDREEVSP